MRSYRRDYVRSKRRLMRRLYMPPTYFISGHKFQYAAINQSGTGLPTRALLGVRPDAVVFGCFNHLNRIDGRIWRAWLRILHAVPTSVLWLQVRIAPNSAPISATTSPHARMHASRFDAIARFCRFGCNQ